MDSTKFMQIVYNSNTVFVSSAVRSFDARSAMHAVELA